MSNTSYEQSAESFFGDIISTYTRAQAIEDGVLIDIRVSQNDFARLSMGSRQRVNRIFREWEKSGLVEHRDDLLWVRDMDTLEKEVVPFE